MPKSEESIGQRIPHIHKNRGMTQKGLSETPNVMQSVVSDYENDVVCIPSDVIAQIVGVLNVSSDDILGLKLDKKVMWALRTGVCPDVSKPSYSLPKQDQEALLHY